jgi:uncharacterized repeat protein (TIGR03803 family)
VTRKIARAAARIARNLDSELVLGNMESRRDWGRAQDYVLAMWLMLQHHTADDYVVATRETHSAREFVEGADPLAGLVQASDGNFYGTTALGGAHYLGSLFRINPAGSLTTLYSLSGSLGEGASPVVALVQASDGNFYGTTALGGAHYWGNVFKFSTSAPAPLL